MSNRVASIRGRAHPRLAMVGLGLLLLSGCSSDVTRFSQSENPFSNPFSNKTADAVPTPGVTASPLGQPVAAGAVGKGPVAAATQPVGGSAAGWTAVGGSPIVVAQGETLN